MECVGTSFRMKDGVHRSYQALVEGCRNCVSKSWLKLHRAFQQSQTCSDPKVHRKIARWVSSSFKVESREAPSRPRCYCRFLWRAEVLKCKQDQSRILFPLKVDQLALLPHVPKPSGQYRTNQWICFRDSRLIGRDERRLLCEFCLLFTLLSLKL